ncbi:hypothetical protein [Gemmiger sp.]
MSGKYDDIIDLPHHVSARHPQMSVQDRAAQFSPFAALTGLDAALQETARLTDRRVTLDEYEQAALDAKLQKLRDGIAAHPRVTVTYFVEDTFKEGGVYRTTAGTAKKFAENETVLVLADGEEITVADILSLEI